MIKIQDVLSEEISFQNLMVGVAYFERFALYHERLEIPTQKRHVRLGTPGLFITWLVVSTVANFVSEFGSKFDVQLCFQLL